MWKMKRRSISNDFEAKIAISNDFERYICKPANAKYIYSDFDVLRLWQQTRYRDLFSIIDSHWPPCAEKNDSQCPYFRHRQTVCLKIVHHCMVVTGRLAGRNGEDHPWIGVMAKPSATDTMAPVFHFKWNWEVSALQVVYYSTAINHAPSDLHASWLDNVPNLLVLRSK